jgi:hypothetical protein
MAEDLPKDHRKDERTAGKKKLHLKYRTIIKKLTKGNARSAPHFASMLCFNLI